MSELSPLEMRLAVPHFSRKVERFRPRVVCLVGKKIWEVYESVVSRTAGVAQLAQPAVPTERGDNDSDDRRDGPNSFSTSESSRFGKNNARTRTRHAAVLPNPYLQESSSSTDIPINPYVEGWSLDRSAAVTTLLETPSSTGSGRVKILSFPGGTDSRPLQISLDASIMTPPLTPQSRSSPTAGARGSAKRKKEFDWHKQRSFRLPHEDGYTYFWVTPNTSGLERTPVSFLCFVPGSLGAAQCIVLPPIHWADATR